MGGAFVVFRISIDWLMYLPDNCRLRHDTGDPCVLVLGRRQLLCLCSVAVN